MPMNAKEAPKGASKNFPVVEAGTYPGRTVGLIDLGLQPQSYMGEEKDPCREVMVTYELVDEFLPDEDGNPDEEKPRHLSENFTLRNLEVDKAKSTARYYALDPDEDEGGDWTKLMDVPVNVTIVHNPGKGKNAGRVFERVAGISPMRAKDKAKCPPLVNPVKIFDLDDPDLEIFNGLPEWIRNKITSNLNFRGSPLEGMLGDGAPPKEDKAAEGKDARDLDDEIPF